MASRNLLGRGALGGEGDDRGDEEIGVDGGAILCEAYDFLRLRR